MTIINVFLFAHAGRVCTLRSTIGIGEMFEYKSVAIAPTIPDPPIPPIIISLYLRKIGCLLVASDSITLFRLTAGFSTRIVFFAGTVK